MGKAVDIKYFTAPDSEDDTCLIMQNDSTEDAGAYSEAKRLAAFADPPRTRRTDGKLICSPVVRQPPLTAHQIAFAQGVLQGKPLRQAYKDAYPNAKGADASISTSASRLLRDQRIQKALRDAQEADPELLMDDPTALKRYVLTQLLRCASQFKQEGSKIKALELMGKSVGLFVDKGEHTAIPVSADQLKKELAGHLRLLDNRNAGEPSTLDAICSVHANRGRH